MDAGCLYMPQAVAARASYSSSHASSLSAASRAGSSQAGQQSPTTIHHNTSRPTRFDQPRSTPAKQQRIHNFHQHPLQFPPRPRWPRSCALACPPQNPATLSLKHRTPQLAGPDNMASIRELLPFAMTSSTAPANLLQQLHRQRRHHTRHHRCRLRHPSRRHSQHQRLQHQLALHSQTLPHRRHRQRQRGCQDRPLRRWLRR